MRFLKRNMLKKAAMGIMAGTMLCSPVLTIHAADHDVTPSENQTYGTDTNDTINYNEKGSVTIHKYDLTAMNEDGIDYASKTSNGEAVDTTGWEQYSIQGVVFSYLKVADIATYTNGSDVQVVYGFTDKDLLDILGLKTSDAFDSSKVQTGETGTHYYFTSNQVNTAIKTILENDDTTAKNRLEAYTIKKGTAMKETDKNGYSTINGQDLGLYLFAETFVPEEVDSTCDPFFVSLPMTYQDGTGWFYDINVYPKNQTDYPTLTKTVGDADDTKLTGEVFTDAGSGYGDTATVSEGDTVNFRIQSRIPVITSDATALSEYSFFDKQESGLSYNQDEIVNVYSSQALANENNPEKAVLKLVKGTDYTSVYDMEANTMKVSLTENGLSKINGNDTGTTVAENTKDYLGNEINGRKANYSGCYLVISYTSLATSDASQKLYMLGDKGNDNDVQLTWRRSNREYSDTIESSVKVFSYGMEIKKQFSDQKGDATKIQFTARNITKNKTQSGYADTDDYYLNAKKVKDGVYEIIESDGKNGDEATLAKDATRFSPDKDGNLKIYGLEGGTYEIVEVKTDTGYSLLKNPIVVDINETTGEVTDSLSLDRADNTTDYPTVHVYQQTRAASATIDNNQTTMKSMNESSNALVSMTVTNNPDFELPKTGGSGLWMITLAGMAGITSGLLLIKKNKKEDEE